MILVLIKFILEFVLLNNVIKVHNGDMKEELRSSSKILVYL